VPFSWTINPYRGCSHACKYCFARKTHEYLDLDSGSDFDSKIVVKVNAAELTRKELAAPKWGGHHIAMGTNVDCYQRAEGRYRLMPGILMALRDAGNPFSILTKGSLILRDLPLLAEAADRTEVGTAVSVGSVDKELWRLTEPGTPSPHKRLEVCATLNEHDIPCGVLMGPILPYLSDSPKQIDAAVRQIAATDATSVAAITLHLRPGAREWFMSWLREHHPELVEPYERLYARGAYAPRAYQETITRRVREAAEKHGIGRGRTARNAHRRMPPMPHPPAPAGEQLSLL
jgi:DNA repair photolyase